MLKDRKIDHINLTVPDMEKAVDFYTKTLFCDIQARYQKGGQEFVFITDGTVVYEITENPGVSKTVIDHIAYVSEDIERDFNYFKNKDKTCLLSDIGFVDFLFENGVYCFFIKGAGNERIEFCQRKKA